MWCLAEQVKANMSTNEVVCTWSNVEWWSWRHIIAARVLIMERLKQLCTDYFNNMRPVHNAASDEQITSKKAWREQKKWILSVYNARPKTQRSTLVPLSNKTCVILVLVGGLSTGIQHLWPVCSRHIYLWDSTKVVLWLLDFLESRLERPWLWHHSGTFTWSTWVMHVFTTLYSLVIASSNMISIDGELQLCYCSALL